MEDNITVPALPPPSQGSPGGKNEKGQKSYSGLVLVIVGIIIVGLIITGAVLLIMSSNDTTARVRDVFIIFMALESIVIGTALVILIVQLATLINLLQNELKPIMEATNETAKTLRGTAIFLSDNLAEPVIKLNSALAGLKQFMDLLRPGRRP